MSIYDPHDDDLQEMTDEEIESGTPTLTDMLELIDVMDVDAMDEQTRVAQNLNGWFAVADDDGINAYFSTERAALRWRLAEVNRRLNG